MRYMVMECHLSYAIVLDEEGRFLKVANMHYEVGQTVTVVVEMKLPTETPRKKKAVRGISSLAAMAACLVLAVMTLFQFRQSTYASVYMSINPQVRIDVNRKDVVVGLEGVNEDGRELVEDYRYKSKQLEPVMDELVDRAIEMNYLHEGGQITLTLDSDSSEWVVRHEDALTSSLNKHLSEKLSVTIDVSDTAIEKEETEAEKKNQPEKIVIPVSPQETEHGETAYGESDYGAPAPAPSESSPGSSSGTNASANTSYSASDESDYGEEPDEDDGITDYGEEQADENSDDDKDDDEKDDGTTDYDTSPPALSQTTSADTPHVENPEVDDDDKDDQEPEDSDEDNQEPEDDNDGDDEDDSDDDD